MIPISFGDFVWEINPTKLKVRYERVGAERELPYYGAVLDARERRLRRVDGEGVFAGPRYWEKFSGLEDVFLGGEERLLTLPGLRPFRAVFTDLEEGYSGGEEALSYRFSFVEARVSQGRVLPEFIRTEREGENLWDIAFRYGLELSHLAEKNGHLFDLGWLEKGERVWL